MRKKDGASDQDHMYRSLKKADGTYSASGYLKRAMHLTGGSLLKKYFKTYLPEAGIFTRIRLSLDFYGCVIRYGATVSDYFEYEFWKKKACVRKQYVTKLYHRKIQKRFNVGSIKPLSDKLLFNEYFKEFRAGISCFSFDRSEEAFLDFVHACDRDIIAKTIRGFSGRGIYLPDVSTDEKARAVYRELKASGEYFAEKVYHQKGILHDIHPFAVNTVRMLTLNVNGEVHIMLASTRFGGSEKPVDNIHNGGMTCEVDLESGCIVGKGRNLRGDCFVRHPMSGHIIPGTQIPRWQEVCDLVTEAAKKLPEVGYIGWDVAVSDDSICLIEGNECANVDIFQVSSQAGIKPMFDRFM